MTDSLKQLLEKLPLTFLLALYLGYLGYQYYAFNTEPTSTLNVKIGELKAAQEDLAKLKKRVKEAQDFQRSLDAKKVELRQLAQDLEDTKASLTDSLDVPAFMKLVLTEGKKVGLIIKSLKPGEITNAEYYSQQVFDMSFTGAYVQVIGFLDRIANLQKIVRVDDFSLKTLSKPTSKIIELQGSLQLKAYRYLGSKADDVLKKGASATPSAATAAPAKGSGT